VGTRFLSRTKRRMTSLSRFFGPSVESAATKKPDRRQGSKPVIAERTALNADFLLTFVYGCRVAIEGHEKGGAEMSISVSTAKNVVRRCLQTIIDPALSKNEVNRLWEYFQSKCAYCGKPVARREAHKDHLIPFHNGGGSDLGNRVLACGACNGDEKRGEEWITFLRLKCTDAKTYRARQKTIEKWREINSAGRRVISKPMRRSVDRAVTTVFLAFDAAVRDVREVKKRQRRNPARVISSSSIVRKS
jgi:hypothetical protein